ncbi:MAG: argininosuccinate lyase, partial [Candidatus Methylomirabilis sp.]|nr:argininosuccinate lyase [Deltaproteobacteria bacterium]
MPPKGKKPKAASSKAWGGRFSGELDPAASAYNASLAFDKRLWREDIEGSEAHARMLGATGILRPGDVKAILGGLAKVRAEIEAGVFPWREAYEDVHLNIEKRLIELVGDVGGKLHTARSRNDQVATDLRLHLRRRIETLRAGVRGLQGALVRLAEDHVDAVMPGYTHLQRAQPVLFAHHLL